MSAEASKHRIRFSLRSLILFVLLAGSGYGLWARWEPWAMVQTVPSGGVNSSGSLLMMDSRHLVVSGYSRNVDLAKPGSTIQSSVLRVWNINTGALVWESSNNSMEARPYGLNVDYIRDQVNVMSPFHLRTYNLRTGKLLRKLLLHPGQNQWLRTAAFDPDGSHVVGLYESVTETGKFDSSILVWDAATGKCENQTKVGDKLQDMAYSFVISTRPRVYVFHSGIEVVMWNEQSEGRQATIRNITPGGLGRQAFASDWTQMVGFDYERQALTIVRIPSGGLIKEIRLPATTLHDAVYSPDGERLACRDSYSLIHILNANSCQRLHTFPLLGRGPHDIVFSTSGHEIATIDRKIITIYRRRRPEYWWGVAWLPELWLMVVLSSGLVWSLRRDRNMGKA